MGTYTLDTDFSALNGPKAGEWLANFRELAQDAFADRENRSRLLGNLLVLERYIHTLEQGLRQTGGQLSKGTRSAVDQLWAYLEGHTVPADFADFANNLYACLLFYDVGESLSDEQAAFDKAYFGDVDYLRVGEDTAAGWAFGLLLQLVAIEGGRLDYSEFTRCTQVDFAGIQEMLELLDDACIELTGTPCPSNEAGNYLNALKEVHLTPLFRQIVSHVQHDLQTARTALPEQYGTLREAYREKTILPEEYAGAFLAC